jgi:HK97 family phage major capsid protein
MKIDELKTMITDTVKEQIAPLQETQRKHEDIFVQTQKEPQVPEQKDAGLTMARAIKCMCIAKNDPEGALAIATGGQQPSKAMYPNDKQVHALLKDLSATTPSEGGFLIGERYSDEIIPLLLSKTVVMQLGARLVPIPGGNLNMPKLTGGATSYYVGESQDATKSQQTFGNVKLSSKRLVTLVPVSNDLIRNASYAADVMVRDDMINQMKLKTDYTAMYGAGTAYTPLGIKLSIDTANITIASATGTLSADIIGTMVGDLMNTNVPMLKPGWIFNSKIWSALYNLKTTTNQYIYRDEMRKGTLEGFPFGVSNQITTANSTAGTTYFDIFLGDFSEFLFGDEMGFEFMASKEASWYDGSSYQSAFTQDQTVLRITSKHDMALRHDEAFLVWNYPTS